jgi:hypothetical protein
LVAQPNRCVEQQILIPHPYPLHNSLLHLFGSLELCRSGGVRRRAGRTDAVDGLHRECSSCPVGWLLQRRGWLLQRYGWLLQRYGWRQSAPLFFVCLRPCPRSPSSTSVQDDGQPSARQRAGRGLPLIGRELVVFHGQQMADGSPSVWMHLGQGGRYTMYCYVLSFLFFSCIAIIIR